MKSQELCRLLTKEQNLVYRIKCVQEKLDKAIRKADELYERLTTIGTQRPGFKHSRRINAELKHLVRHPRFTNILSKLIKRI